MKKKSVLAAIGFAITLTSCTNNSSDMQDVYFTNLEKAQQKYELCKAEDRLYAKTYNEIELEVKILESKMPFTEAEKLKKENAENLACRYARKAIQYDEYLSNNDLKMEQETLEKVFQAEPQINKRTAELNKQYENHTLKEVAQVQWDQHYEKQCAITPSEKDFNFDNYVDCEAMKQVLLARIPNETNKMREKTLPELLKLEPKVCNPFEAENVMKLKEYAVFIPDCVALLNVVGEKAKNEPLLNLAKMAVEINPFINKDSSNSGSFFMIANVHDNRANYLLNSYLLDYKKFKAAYFKCASEAKSVVENTREELHFQDVMEKLSYECEYLDDEFPKLGLPKITSLVIDSQELKALKYKQ